MYPWYPGAMAHSHIQAPIDQDKSSMERLAGSSFGQTKLSLRQTPSRRQTPSPRCREDRVKGGKNGEKVELPWTFGPSTPYTTFSTSLLELVTEPPREHPSFADGYETRGLQ